MAIKEDFGVVYVYCQNGGRRNVGDGHKLQRVREKCAEYGKIGFIMSLVYF